MDRGSQCEEIGPADLTGDHRLADAKKVGVEAAIEANLHLPSSLLIETASNHLRAFPWLFARGGSDAL
jgi:hypothetical protein